MAEPQLIIDNYFVAPDDIAAQYCFFYNFVRNLEFFELEILVEEILTNRIQRCKFIYNLCLGED